MKSNFLMTQVWKAGAPGTGQCYWVQKFVLCKALTQIGLFGSFLPRKSQFLQENAGGDSVKGSTEVWVDNVDTFSLIH